jgi:putative peptidoglycan lipid II flippase
LPALAAQLAAGDTLGAKNSQATALWAAGLLTLPATIGLFVLAEPIVSVLFERGAFGAEDTKVTSQLVQAFCFGLPAFVFVKALQPSFFARQDTKTPLIDGAIGVGVNIGLSLWFLASYGALAIAAATSMAGWVTLGLMVVRLQARGIFALDAALARRLAAQLLAALIMGGALKVALAQSDLWGLSPTFLFGQIIHLAALVGLGAMVFFAFARLLGAVQSGDFDRLRGRV